MIRLDESDHDLILLLEHDLFGKPVPAFPDHALAPVAAPSAALAAKNFSPGIALSQIG
jgi:hypothetical protein